MAKYLNSQKLILPYLKKHLNLKPGHYSKKWTKYHYRSGFIIPNNGYGQIVYICTNDERYFPPLHGGYCRYADSFKDFSGHTNNWFESYEDLIKKIKKGLIK